jgi:hypothetical protein
VCVAGFVLLLTSRQALASHLSNICSLNNSASINYLPAGSVPPVPLLQCKGDLQRNPCLHCRLRLDDWVWCVDPRRRRALCLSLVSSVAAQDLQLLALPGEFWFIPPSIAAWQQRAHELNLC